MNACLNGSQSVVLEPATSVLPGNFLEMQILGPHPDLLNQNFTGGAQKFRLLTSLLHDSNAQANLRTTFLAQIS